MESTEIYLLADGVLVKASFVNFREIWTGAIADFMGSVFSKQDFLHGIADNVLILICTSSSLAV